MSNISFHHTGLNHCHLWLFLAVISAFSVQLPARAAETDMPPLCTVQTTPQGQISSSAAGSTDDCIELGAAVGELGLTWRQKLPDNVRWVTRKDASAVCTQNQSDMGQKVGSLLTDGCVFLTPKICTIVTSGYISHAMLGNAVRDCAP